MTAWFDDLREFDAAIRKNGELAGGVCRNYPVATALGIYRNNYRGNLRGALALSYPVILQIVGEEFFRMTATRYIASHPSRSGNLHDYGVEFSRFLGSYPPARELPYLPDIAKLEWACHRAYFAEDRKPLDIAAMAEVEPEDRANLRFFFHPACRIVPLTFPIVTIWQAHQPGMPTESQIDLDSGPQNALVSRQTDIIRVGKLSDAETDWLERIRRGAPLWAATAAVLEKHPGFDLQSQLADWVSREILIDFDLDPQEH